MFHRLYNVCTIPPARSVAISDEGGGGRDVRVVVRNLHGD